MDGQRFDINGIKVTARSLGGGLYVGIPDNLLDAFKALLNGKLFEPRTITPLVDVPMPRPYTAPQPTSTATKPVDPTITAYRETHNLSRTAMADFLGISRRSLGRWERKGKRMSEV